MFWPRKRPADDFTEEVRAHLQLEADDLKAAGLTAAEAQSGARKAFGNVMTAEERFYERGRSLWFDHLLQDLRYSLRVMRQSPSFTIAAVFTLALGMGANTAIFSLIDTVLLRSLPVTDPAGLYFLKYAGAKGIYLSPPYPCFERFRSQAKSISGVAAYTGGDFKIRIDGRTEQVFGARVSGEYFSVLGLDPGAGRLLTHLDEKLDPPAAVISYRYWQRRFGGNPDAIGKTFVMAVGDDKNTTDRTFTIVGVTPKGFDGLLPGRTDDLAVPITTMPTMLRDPRSPWFESIARLRPGVQPSQAHAEIDAIFQSFMDDFPQSAEARRDQFHHMELTPASRGLDDLRQRFSRPLMTLMVVVGLVLLIACANITNLLLARAAKREREFAVRIAIGAGRGRILRQLLVETAVLFTAGATAGAFLAWWVTKALAAFLATGARPVLLDAHWDWRVLSFTAGMSLFATLLFGAAPILRAIRTDLHSSMKNGARASASRAHLDAGRLLIAVQIALSMILLVGASLFLRTLVNLHTVDLGFRTDHVALASIQLMESSYPKEVDRIAAWDRLLTRVRSLPGVRSAGLSMMTPLDGSGRRVGFKVPGFLPRSDEDTFISLNTVSKEYFATLGTPMSHGRAFTERDRLGVPAVAILNQSAAQYFFAGRDPIGTMVNINDRQYQIVGVVHDTKNADIRQDAGRFIYISLRQPYDRNFRMTLSARTASDPQFLIPAIQSEVRTLGPDILITDNRTLAQQLDESLLRERLISTLALAFGLLALVLSAVGLYGVLAYSVARRSAEIGIRVALGASPGQVEWSILRQTIWLVAIGLAAGVPASICLAGLAVNLFYGVTPTDAATQVCAAAMLGAVTFVASYLPARKAGRTDPLVALRYE
ncbi:MAG: hypothetical protein JWO48_3612 [Bryobacterales bacterium]|nr:hypothetical protein [Bryobacterales bacterium]